MLLLNLPAAGARGAPMDPPAPGKNSKTGADWLENHRGHGRRLRAPSQSASSTAAGPGGRTTKLLVRLGRSKAEDQAEASCVLSLGECACSLGKEWQAGSVVTILKPADDMG